MIHSDEFLYELGKLFDEIKSQNQDLMVAIFGPVGSGKSTLAINIAKYIDPTFNAETLPNRMAHTKEDFAFKQGELNPYEAIIWDEAHKLQRRSQWDQWNKRYLDYFSDSRGLNQVTILCFPNIIEIDRNIIERSRLFLQAYRKGDRYGVFGWTKAQIKAKLQTSRLFSQKSIAAAWTKAGGRYSKLSFLHDLNGIKEENIVYSELKKQNLKRTKANLVRYGSLALPDLCLEIATQAKYSMGYIQNIASKVINEVYQQELIDTKESGQEPEIEKLPAGWSIKTSRMKNELRKEIISRLSLDETVKKKLIYKLVFNKEQLNSECLQESNILTKGGI